MTKDQALKRMYGLLLTEPHAPTLCEKLEAIVREALAQPVQLEQGTMFKVDVARRKWDSLQADGHEMQHIAFAKGLDTGSIDAWGKVVWLEATPPLPVQPKVRTGDCLLTGFCAAEGHKIQKAQPVQRPWVGLTVDELIDIEQKYVGHESLTRSIEAKLKEKNT